MSRESRESREREREREMPLSHSLSVQSGPGLMAYGGTGLQGRAIKWLFQHTCCGGAPVVEAFYLGLVVRHFERNLSTGCFGDGTASVSRLVLVFCVWESAFGHIGPHLSNERSAEKRAYDHQTYANFSIDQFGRERELRSNLTSGLRSCTQI